MLIRQGKAYTSAVTAAQGTHPAPLKETLAAAVLQQIGYCGRKPLLDVMCGSGTIAIEAAMMALRQAPLLQRPAGVFGFERLLDFDAKLWHATRERLQREARPKLTAPIFASDIEDKLRAIGQGLAPKKRGWKSLLNFPPVRLQR